MNGSRQFKQHIVKINSKEEEEQKFVVLSPPPILKKNDNKKYILSQKQERLYNQTLCERIWNEIPNPLSDNCTQKIVKKELLFLDIDRNNNYIFNVKCFDCL